MGREIRRVPKNWKHPLREYPQGPNDFHPMHDEEFDISAREWLDNCIAWENGTHEDLIKHPEYKEEFPFYWQWEGDPPDPKYYRPKFENTEWYQIYETVSEGTPVTPPFATKEELVNYLVEFGDFWQQSKYERRFSEAWCRDAEKPGWNRKSAEQFVESEWAPSMWINETGVHTIENSTMP